jgi:hypothetical protein
VQLRYRSAAEHETEREVDVYGLVWRGNAWYAVRYCHLRCDLRSFRLDRALGVECLPKSFGRPPGFDVLDTSGRTLPRSGCFPDSVGPRRRLGASAKSRQTAAGSRDAAPGSV